MKTKFNQSAKYELCHIETGEKFGTRLSTKELCLAMRQMNPKQWTLEPIIKREIM